MKPDPARFVLRLVGDRRIAAWHDDNEIRRALLVLMHCTPPVALVVALLSVAACGSDATGGAGGSGGATAGEGGAGATGSGGDGGGAGGEPVTCFGDPPPEGARSFTCGGAGLTCRVDEACVRYDVALEGTGATHADCPEPAGCAGPPDDRCWIYECWDLPPDCGASCDCLEPHLAYEQHPAATCTDAGGVAWIAGAPSFGLPPWRDACFGECAGDERCWECGPIGGCFEDSVDPGCQPWSQCSAEDPSVYPHPTCSERPPL